MGVVYAVANQKGGVGKTTTAVNLAACVAAAGSQTLLVDLDPQCNATVALGLDRDLHPSSYDCLTGDVSVAEAARPAGPDNLWLVPASRDLAGAAVELPRIEGSETRLRERLGPVRERFAFTLLDCPPSLGPVSVNALTAADRVIVPVQAEYLALEGLVQFLETLAMIRRELNPALEVSGLLITMHDERTRLAQDVESELRRALPRNGLRDGDTPQRPSRRGPQLWSAGDRARPSTRAVRTPTGRWPGSWRSVASGPKRGIGRGLAAILPETVADGRRRAARAPGRLDQAKSRTSRAPEFDPESLAGLASSIEASGVVQPLLVRPLARRQLRADRRRAALASGAGRRAWRRCRRWSATPRRPSACRRR